MSLFDQIAQQHYAAPPEGWQTKKIKFLADIQTSNVDKLTDDDEEAVRLCNYTDVYYNDRITPDLSFMEATATPKEIEKFTLQAGQVFITKDSEGWDDIGIPALVAEDMPGVLCGYHLAIFTPDSDKLDGAFLAWLCRADALNDQFKLSANGVTRFGLGQYSMKNAVVGYPPLETQKRIAAFLDEKTAQIDALVASKQALLERLAEKRQAMITQAVIRGLNSAAPMKDSGIDWLGQIPAHWMIKRLRHISPKQSVGVVVNPSNYIDENGIRSFIYGADISEYHVDWEGARRLTDQPFRELEKSKLYEGDLVTVRVGDPGVTAVVDARGDGSNCASVMFIRRGSFCSRWLAYVMNSRAGRSEVERVAYGAAQKQFNIEHALYFRYPTPPHDEQVAIADYLDVERDKIKLMMIAVGRSIVLLNEYRSALITSAVTGHIEALR